VETATTSRPNALLQMTEHILDKTCSEPLDIQTTKSRHEPRPFFSRVNAKEFSFSPFFPDGTINFDSEQVMFEISWQRPNDYNITTGLADPYAGGNAKDRLPIQSTVYQATRVISEFRQGKFESSDNHVIPIVKTQSNDCPFYY
jgi:hypothetical protein